MHVSKLPFDLSLISLLLSTPTITLLHGAAEQYHILSAYRFCPWISPSKTSIYKINATKKSYSAL